MLFCCRELEDEVEFLRRDVVQSKRVMNGSKLERLNLDLEALGRNLAELKSMYLFVMNFMGSTVFAFIRLVGK